MVSDYQSYRAKIASKTTIALTFQRRHCQGSCQEPHVLNTSTIPGQKRLGKYQLVSIIPSSRLLKDIHSHLSMPSRTFIVGVPDPKTDVTLSLRDLHSRKDILVHKWSDQTK